MFKPEDFASKVEFNRARFDAIDVGRWRLPGFFKPCTVRILIVVDGYDGSFLNVTFGQLYFSLSAVVHELENNPEWWVKYQVTKAHRQNDPLGEADMNGFRFTQPGFDIDSYDQVWFFGARSNENESERLSDDELAIVSRWMDEKQGGVFATGDHADLGASLCARIPRVRSMRKWTNSQGVPSATGTNRHDTLRQGHDTTYTFNDESDDIPQSIDVTMYPVRSWRLPFFRSEMPHPVLCGTKGIINVFPDHPHEGEVVLPASLTNNFSFPGYTNKPEYPESAPGVRPQPDIIARANVLSRTSAQDTNKGAVTAKTFGIVGAYDGHQADVGRVVTDSTWHHWFDVNLIGRPGGGADPIDPVGATDPKSFGFPYSVAGTAAYAKIRNYFRNVAVWLAPPARQRCMFFRATWWVVQRYPLVETLHPALPVVEIGGYALDALGRHAGQCMVRHWLWELVPRDWRERIWPPLPDPCLSCPPIEVLERILLGSVARSLLELSYAAQTKNTIVEERAAEEALNKGLHLGGKLFTEMLEDSQRSAASLVRTLKRHPLRIDTRTSRKAQPGRGKGRSKVKGVPKTRSKPRASAKPAGRKKPTARAKR